MKKLVLLKNILAWTVAFIWLVPFISLLFASIRPFEETRYGWWNFSEFNPTLKQYATALSSLGRSIVNTIVITLPGTILPLIVAAMAAYVFARFSFPVKNLLFLFNVICMILPVQLVMVPLFFIMKELSILNSYFGIILVHTVFGLPWLTFFLRNFFMAMPRDLEEASQVDGCNTFQTFSKVVLPIMLPAIAACAVIQAAGIWCDLLLAVIFLQSPELFPITLGIVRLKGRYYVDFSLLSAASIISLIIPAAAFLILQKYFVRGMISGAIKG